MKTVIVDAVGEPCPIPVVKATKALRELGEPLPGAIYTIEQLKSAILTAKRGCGTC